MPNELLKGTRRTGDFYDTYEETPEVKVTLERSDAGIGITVAWSGPEVPYALASAGEHLARAARLTNNWVRSWPGSRKRPPAGIPKPR